MRGDTAGPEAGTDVEEIQEEGGGPSNAELFGDPRSFAGRQVTISAEVSEIISPNSFTIAAENEEPLLVVSDGTPQVDLDTPVQVTGTVLRTFDVAGAEDFVETDLDDPLYTGYGTEPYIQASSIDTMVTPTQSGE